MLADVSLAGAQGRPNSSRWAATPLSLRQVKLLKRLLDGFDGKLTSSKWAAIAKCSPDTALRDIKELLVLGVLRRSAAGGRSTSYDFVARHLKTPQKSCASPSRSSPPLSPPPPLRSR
jgi:hypothetical protein